jgi:hypothetical protein
MSKVVRINRINSEMIKTINKTIKMSNKISKAIKTSPFSFNAFVCYLIYPS